jgi:hypothetical protein
MYGERRIEVPGGVEPVPEASAYVLEKNGIKVDYEKAQKLADAGIFVVAAEMGAQHGHVSIILPGSKSQPTSKADFKGQNPFLIQAGLTKQFISIDTFQRIDPAHPEPVEG